MKNDFCVFDCSTRGERNQRFGAEGGTSQVPPPLLPRKALGRWVICPLKMEREGKWALMGAVMASKDSTSHTFSKLLIKGTGCRHAQWALDHLSADNIPLRSKRQLSFVMASRNNRSLVPGQRLQRLSSSSKEAPAEKKHASTTQLLQWKIQTNWTSYPKARI